MKSKEPIHFKRYDKYETLCGKFITRSVLNTRFKEKVTCPECVAEFSNPVDKAMREKESMITHYYDEHLGVMCGAFNDKDSSSNDIKTVNCTECLDKTKDYSALKANNIRAKVATFDPLKIKKATIHMIDASHTGTLCGKMLSGSTLGLFEPNKVDCPDCLTLMTKTFLTRPRDSQSLMDHNISTIESLIDIIQKLLDQTKELNRGQQSSN